ncbi:MAG: cold shock domain-containing protein [Bacteroidia bacterium]|nr:cold shock domain-containing protein [Bacteroidia bacterium]
MAKSQDTFSKKEREKKKQKKRQEKEQKKEDRKANSGKGKTLEEMMAYVDEFGNITSTPPDPARKNVINVDDIQIGVSKREPVDPADLIRKGMITFFNESKGYGFIRDLDSQESIFVHANALEVPVKEKDKVTFETEMTPKGLSAIKVKLTV